jgi:hypothetical protein
MRAAATPLYWMELGAGPRRGNKTPFQSVSEAIIVRLRGELIVEANLMRRLGIALLSSAAIAVGVIYSTTPAAAFWPLLIPVVLGVSAGGVVAGAAIANAYPPPTTIVTTTTGSNSFPPPSTAFGPPAPAPEPGCSYSRRFVNGAWRRVEICD